MVRVAPRLLAFVLLLAWMAAGCERAKSANPLSPSIAGPIAGVSIEAPKLASPANASQIAVDQQPVKLTVENASTSGVRPLTYIFELSAEAEFATKLFSQTGIEPGKEGTTSLLLPQTLAPERSYYWRAKADDGANASEYSSVASFRVYTPVVIQPPALHAPADGETVDTRRPTLVVTNAQRTGPAGAIQYLFELATDAAFGSKVFAVLVSEGTNQTSYTSPDDLAYSTRYYWRVKTMDPGHESGYSSTRSFTTPAAPPPPPAPPPPGPRPNPAAVDMIDMRQATILNSPLDLGSWPATSAITSLELTRNGVHAEFSKADGPDRWPDVYPPGWDEPLQYTLGMCENIGGRWYCSAVIQFWYGLYSSGGPPELYPENWFYAANRWAPMTGYYPAVGELVGFFVCAGNCRNNTSGSGSIVKERTNVVLVPYPGAAGGTYRF